MRINKLYISLVIIGILVIAYPIIGKIIDKKNQTYVIYKYEENINKMDENSIQDEKKKYEKYNNEILNNKSTHIDLLQTGKQLGYIKIEKIKLFLPIYEGTNEKTLYEGIGHLEDTSLPTKKGCYHAVFLGHSGITGKELFDNLDKLKINDFFTITILNESFEFKIYNIKKVLPNQTKDLKVQRNKKLATLITCTPKYINSHRLLIMGELVE